jgi:hypothetical protein
MASGSKTKDVFTREGMGDGKSEGIKSESLGKGQTLKSAYPQDNVHGFDTPGDEKGVNAFGGGQSYLGHSLKGASAVMDPNKSGMADTGRDLKGRRG